MLSAENKEKIKEHALANPDRECGGFLVENANGTFVYKGHNASRRNDRFVAHPTDYVNASMIGKITSVYHSHISNEEFSELDIQSANLHKLNFILYHVKKDFFKIIPRDAKSKYCGRGFTIGSSDCFSIVRDYYLDELSIKINNFERGANWTEKNPDLIDSVYEKEGFVKVEEPQKHDILTFSFGRDHSKHMGIYIGNEFIIHQPREGKSVIEDLARYKGHIKHILRHKSLC
jgi:proteasome lid subunit RPN8/RPN11